MNEGAESASRHHPSRRPTVVLFDGSMALQILAEQLKSLDCPLAAFEDIDSDSWLAYGFLFLNPVACKTTSLFPLPGPTLSDGDTEDQNKVCAP